MRPKSNIRPQQMPRRPPRSSQRQQHNGGHTHPTRSKHKRINPPSQPINDHKITGIPARSPQPGSKPQRIQPHPRPNLHNNKQPANSRHNTDVSIPRHPLPPNQPKPPDHQHRPSELQQDRNPHRQPRSRNEIERLTQSNSRNRIHEHQPPMPPQHNRHSPPPQPQSRRKKHNRRPGNPNPHSLKRTEPHIGQSLGTRPRRPKRHCRQHTKRQPSRTRSTHPVILSEDSRYYATSIPAPTAPAQTTDPGPTPPPTKPQFTAQPWALGSPARRRPAFRSKLTPTA
jgi:hypothetical protein